MKLKGILSDIHRNLRRAMYTPSFALVISSLVILMVILLALCALLCAFPKTVVLVVVTASIARIVKAAVTGK